MESYFDSLPDELFVIIVYYLPIDDLKNEYIQFRLMNKWPLLFTLAFPDIDIKSIENIDFAFPEFEYLYLIYKNLKKSYLLITDSIEDTRNKVVSAINKLPPEERNEDMIKYIYHQFNISYQYEIQGINSFKLLYKFLNGHPDLKDQFINGKISNDFYIDFSYDRYYLLFLVHKGNKWNSFEIDYRTSLTFAVNGEYHYWRLNQ